jgi:Family of unknown function (DUF6941)
MLLCDAAQVVGGKLYILGGGWSRLTADQPIPMSLAIRLAVPWDRTNETIRLRAVLLTDGGDYVEIGDTPVQNDGEVVVGRPPDALRGAPLDATLAMDFHGLQLPEGGYVWTLEVDDQVRARGPFQAVKR